MNDTKWAALDYVMNRFFPYAMIAFMVFIQFGFLNFQPYLIMGLIWFIEKTSFGVGRSVGYYEGCPEYKEQVDKEIKKDMEE